MKHVPLAFALVGLVCAASAPSWAQPAAASTAQRIQVDQFVVSGSTLLPGERIDAALAAYRGSRTLAELQQAAQAVQALYRDAGWGAVVAYLPEQSLAGGRVQIAVLEGRVQRVEVIGNRHASTDSVRRALPALKEGTTPRPRELDAQLLLANENPARQLALVLEPGRASGEVDARISVTDRPLSAWTATLDNTGTRQTGEWRITVGWRHASLGGRDHQLALNYQTSVDKPDRVSIASAFYSVPLPERLTRIDLYAARSDVDGGTTSTAAGALQFVGKGNVLGVRASRLLERAGEWDRRVIATLDRREYLNDCSIVGLPPGACGAAGASVAVTPLTVEGVWQRAGAAPLGFNVALSRNLGFGGRHTEDANFEAVRAGAKPGYTTLRVAGSGSPPPWGAGWRVHWRAAGQFTPDALVPGEQFGVAGATTVRGYAEREVVGDNAALASVEMHAPEWTAAGRGWRALGFADLGVASNRRDAECRTGLTRCTVAALGVGLRSSPGPWQLRADLAWPLKDGNRSDRGDARLHLSASLTLE